MTAEDVKGRLSGNKALSTPPKIETKAAASNRKDANVQATAASPEQFKSDYDAIPAQHPRGFRQSFKVLEFRRPGNT